MYGTKTCQLYLFFLTFLGKYAYLKKRSENLKLFHYTGSHLLISNKTSALSKNEYVEGVGKGLHHAYSKR